MLTFRLLTLTAVFLGASTTAAVAAPGPPPLLQGRIVTEQDPNRCLTGGPAGTQVHTAPCVPGSEAQSFYQTSAGHFTNDGQCVRPDSAASGAKVRVATCTYRDDQEWWFATTLRAGQFGRCLTEVAVDQSGRGNVRLRDCSDKANRKWRVL